MSAQQPSASPQGASAASAAAEPRVRAAIHYAVEGDARFISHHDEMRMLQRALVRARWPIAYSQGFNPKPRLAILLPRSVGTASVCQLAVIELAQEQPPEQLLAQLAAALPGGVRALRVASLPPRGTPHPRRASYRLPLDGYAEELSPRIAALLARGEAVVQRRLAEPEPPRAVDVRPYIEAIELEDAALVLHLRIEQQGAARPGEILELLEIPAEIRDRGLTRTAVQWDMNLGDPDSLPGQPERNSLDEEEST